MLKRILLSGVALTFCAGVAAAQTAAPDHSTPPAAQGGSMSAPSAGAGGSASQGQQADASLFSSLKGADVVGSDSKDVGRLADILLDDQGNIKQIVIGSGGVAGVGETLHAYDQTTLPALNSDGKVELGLTTASLESLPEYTYPEKVETGRATTGDAGSAGGAMSSGTAGSSSGAMSPNPSAPGAASGTAAPPANDASGGSQASADASSGAASGSASGSAGNMLSSDNAGSQMGAAGGSASSAPEAGASAGSNDQTAAATGNTDASKASSSGSSAMGASGQAWPASYLVGANIANTKEGAEVGDLHFADNKVDKVIINHGGTLGIGQKQMEVAFNDLQISGDATAPKVELQGDALTQLNAAAEQEKAQKDMSAPAK